MDLNAYSFANKKAIAFNMGGGDKACEQLLQALSTQELILLRRYPDLIQRVRVIAKMTSVQALAELQEEYSLQIDAHAEDLVISTEKLEKAIPAWFVTNHSGGFKSLQGGEFLEWAKEFLMQEVRINVWIKYLEHRKDPGPKDYFGYYL